MLDKQNYLYWLTAGLKMKLIYHDRGYNKVVRGQCYRIPQTAMMEEYREILE